MRLKLLRRSQIIDALRKAYLEDVVVVKNELMRKSDMTEEVQRGSWQTSKPTSSCSVENVSHRACKNYGNSEHSL